MNIKLNISSLETQIVEVKQFEHNVTTVSALFKAEDIHEDIMELVPCILLSFGEKITKDNGLSYIIAQDVADIGWCISEECTQKPGTYFAQFAFMDKDETIKVYTDKFTFKVLPSVDIQKAAFEYKPRFIEEFQNNIIAKVGEMLPTKLSQLENDTSFSTAATLSEYAKTEDIDNTLKAYSKVSDVDEKLEAYAKSDSLESYATTDSVDQKLESYSTIDTLNTRLMNYPTLSVTSEMIASFYKSKHATVSYKCYVPEEVSERTVSNLTLTPDSTSTYYQTFFIDKFADSSDLKLSDFMLNICTMGKDSTVSADVKIEINTTNGTGTLLIKDSDLLTKDDAANVYIAYSKVLGVARLEYTKLRGVESVSPITTKNRFIGIGAPTYIRNVKVTFIPTSPSEPTTNFLSGFRIMLSGTKYA